MFILPDTVSDYYRSNDGGDNSKHWPDFENPFYGCVDKEGTEHQHESGFQNAVEPFLWRFQASTPPVLYLLGSLYRCTLAQDSRG